MRTCAQLVFRLLPHLLVSSLIAAAPVLTPASGQAASTQLPFGHWAYPLIEDLRVAGYLPGLSPFERTYQRGRVAEELSRLLGPNAPTLDPTHAYMVERLRRSLALDLGTSNLQISPEAKGSYTSSDKGEDQVRGQFWGETDIRVLSWGSLLHRFVVDSKGEQNPRLRGREWRAGYYGAVDHVCLSVGGPRFRADLGRTDVAWGPGESGSLILSGYGPALDVLLFDLRVGPVRFLSFVTELDRMEVRSGQLEERLPSSAPDSSLAEVNRFMSAHRLEWQATRSLLVGLTEVVIYGGYKRSFELHYLNPFTLYFAEQWNIGRDDNLLWCLDLAYCPSSRWEIYGQLLLDDFQYDFTTEPHEIGFLVGWRGYRVVPVLEGGFCLEYARTQPWVYGHNRPWNQYSFADLPLGHRAAGDADMWYARYRHRFLKYWTAEMVGELLRLGEAGMEVERSPEVEFPDTFPSGTVETTSRLTCGLYFDPRPSWGFYLAVTRESIRHRDHDPNLETSTEFLFSAALAFRPTWSTMLWPAREPR